MSSFRFIFPCLFFISRIFCLSPDEAAQLAIKESNLNQLWESYQKIQFWHEKRKLLWDNPELQLAFGEKFSEGSRGPTFTVSISQTFPWPQRVEIKEKIKNLTEILSQREVQKLQQEVAHYAFLAAFKLSLSQEKLNHLKKRQKSLEAIETYLKKRPFVSPKQQAEKEIVKSRLIQLSQELITYQEEEIKWQERLYYLTKEKWAQLKHDFSWPKINFALVVDKLTQNNLNLKTIYYNFEIEKYRENFAQTLKIPDFQAGIYHTQELTAKPDIFYGITFTIPLPIQDSGRYLAKESENRKNYYEALYIRKKEELERELFEKILTYEIYRQNIQNFSNFEEAEDFIAKKSLKYFQLGQIELITFLEWENSYHEKLHIYLQNLEKLYELYLSIQELCGVIVPNFFFPQGEMP